MKIDQRQRDQLFEDGKIMIEKMANANISVGEPIVTASGMQVIPLSSVTIVNMSGGGEYGDVKTFREADGFKLAGGNGNVVSVKPKGFLVDNGKECRFVRVDEEGVEALLDKTKDLIQSIQHE